MLRHDLLMRYRSKRASRGCPTDLSSAASLVIGAFCRIQKTDDHSLGTARMEPLNSVCASLKGPRLGIGVTHAFKLAAVQLVVQSHISVLDQPFRSKQLPQSLEAAVPGLHS